MMPVLAQAANMIRAYRILMNRRIIQKMIAVYPDPRDVIYLKKISKKDEWNRLRKR
jgi:hypothetical protein